MLVMRTLAPERCAQGSAEPVSRTYFEADFIGDSSDVGDDLQLLVGRLNASAQAVSGAMLYYPIDVEVVVFEGQWHGHIVLDTYAVDGTDVVK